MKVNIKSGLLIIAIICLPLLTLSCASTVKNVPMFFAETRMIDQNLVVEGIKTVTLAMSYYRQGGYDKCGSLLSEAADIFHESNDYKKERKTLLQAAKIHLKFNNREVFVQSMCRIEGLIDKFEMPSEEERLFLNIAAKMGHKNELPYPVMAQWRTIFR